MLTPGIEYFGARDDGAAVAFADGNAPHTPTIVRGDGIGPDFPMSAFGALLTGRSIEDLSTEPELTTLSFEVRDVSGIHLFRLPEATAVALSRADADQLADVGRRALVYGELSQADPALIAAFLADLGESIRRGGGGLNARVIVPATRPRPARFIPGIRTAMPWFGLGLGALLLIGAFVIGSRAPGVYTPVVVGTGLIMSLSVGTLLTRRGARRAFALGQGTAGSIVVRVETGAGLLGALPLTLAEVVGPLHLAPSSRHVSLHLRADSTGLAFVFGDAVVHVPRDLVRGIAAAEISPSLGGAAATGRVLGLVIVLRVDEHESVVCELPILDLQGGRATHAQIAEIARDMSRLTGAQVG